MTTNLIIVEEENIIFFCKKKINVRCLFILSATYCREDRHSLMSSKLLLYISLLHQLPLCGTHSIHFFGYIPTYLSSQYNTLHFDFLSSLALAWYSINQEMQCSFSMVICMLRSLQKKIQLPAPALLAALILVNRLIQYLIV